MRIATLGSEQPWIGAFCREVMTLQFAHDREIDDPDKMHGLLSGLSLPADDILRDALTPQNK